MTKHKHYDVIRQWMEDTSLEVEVKSPKTSWEAVAIPAWWEHCEYRIKPKTLYTARVEIPQPERVEPQGGSYYYFPELSTAQLYNKAEWGDFGVDAWRFKRGLVYLTAEDAAAAGKAMCQREEG